jgi:dihydropteroate synthase-like protein
LNSPSRFAGEHILLLTGRLAEPALRRMVDQLQNQFAVRLTIEVLPITVAALMFPEWIARHLKIPAACDRIILPGYCEGDLQPIVEKAGIPVECGPRDLRQLPEWFGGASIPVALDNYSIEIIAEINQAPRLGLPEIIETATRLHRDGADLIDIGCLPGMIWQEVDTVVAELVARGIRVSIDSMHPAEIGRAAAAGAELVLSVNSSNRHVAPDWGCEVVVIPDHPQHWLQMTETIEFLAAHDVALRIDPILEPVGFGFAASLSRYMQARSRWPDARMMMGIGNLTELTDVDSAGVNLLLLAICEELAIGSVLTTEVINWTRTSVRECDIGRRLVHAAVAGSIPPKNLDPRLVCLRDPRLIETPVEDLQELARSIRDNNYRINVADGQIHLTGSGKHWCDGDAFELFQQLIDSGADNLDASHSFYLGYELCKATIAARLGKQYEQDHALRWGHLTIDEVSHRRLKRRKAAKWRYEAGDSRVD